MENLTPELKKELFPDNLVLSAYRGSIAHGMYVPNTDPNSIDDVDMMGVYLAPKEYYIGLGNPIDFEKGIDHRKSVERFIGKYDVVSYEFRKFVHMLLQSNPNVLGMLWLKEEHYLSKSLAGQLLIDNRDLFVSNKAYQAFTGYAFDQLKKMTHINKQGYMGEKRKALVNKYGYDCKNAAHCLRLLTMGFEYLKTGELNVYREHDAQKFLDVKLGKWTLEQVQSEAKVLFDLADAAYLYSKLPESPNYTKVEKLVIEILTSYLYK